MGSRVFFTNLRRYLHLVLAFLVVLVSSSVLVGWILRHSEVIQLHEDFAPMVVNTAISFLILGISFLFSEGAYRRFTSFGVAAVLFLAVVNMLQYFFGFQLGIDNLFGDPFLSGGVSAPGRMAISTTVCFLIAGTLGFLQGRTPVSQMAKVSLSSLLFGFALVGLLGYVLQFSADYGWGSYSRMAVHTALCFMLLAGAHFWQLRRTMLAAGISRVSTVPLYVVLIGIMVSVMIWQLLLFRDLERNRSMSQLQAEGFRSKLEGAFIPMEKTLEHMARRMASGAYPDERVWTMDARFYLDELTGLNRVFVVGPEHKIKWIFPVTSVTEALVDTMAGRTREVGEVLEEVRKSHEIRISKVARMQSGANGFVVVAPVLRNGEYLGAVVGAVDLSIFIDKFSKSEGYLIVLKQGDNEIYRSAELDPVLSREWRTYLNYQYRGVEWNILFTPSNGLVRKNISAIPAVVLIFGVGFSVLLGVSLSFYARANELGRRARAVADWKSAAMNATPMMIVSMDENCIIREMNSTAEAMTGWKTRELAGKHLPVVFHDPQDLELFRVKLQHEAGREISLGTDLVEAMFELGYSTATEWVYVARNGRRFIGVMSLGRVLDDQGNVTGYLVVVEDVTQKREKERQLKEQESKIIASSRMASLGEMAAGIAHEINNPLTIINGHMGVLRRDLSQRGLGEDVELQRRIEVVESTVQRIAKIVKGLRSYARESEQGDLEVVNVAAIVDETLAFCADRFKHENIELAVKVESSLQVRARPYQISQVLLNLLNNAADALQQASVRRVEVAAVAGNEGVEISVMDNGPGVPLFLRDRIMEPFFTTKEVGKGVGLGLSISESIVRGHGGRFYLDENSAYTRFVIWLPNGSA